MCGLTAHLLAADYDFVLRHGRVIDGMGNPARFEDVAVKDGRVAAVGRIAGHGDREVDVQGLVIAPGFIDVHTHAEDIDELPLAENFVRMGVTTLVLGNCGGSVRNVGQFFHDLAATNVSPNVATLIGHGTVRGRAMGGDFDRVPTPEELERMKEMVEQAMKDGASGLSTGLISARHLCEDGRDCRAGQGGREIRGIYASHMRSEAPRFSRRWTRCSDCS